MSHRASRRLVRAATAGLVVAVLSAFATATAPAASAAPNIDWFNTVQFNIYGNTGGGGYNAPIAGDVIASLASRNTMPFAVTLQEVCGQQFLEIAQFFQANFPTFGSWFTNAFPNGGAPSNPNCSTYGNAVYSLRGTQPSVQSNLYYSGQGTGPNEKRNANCVRSYGTPRMEVCSTHLKASNPPVAEVQSADFRGSLEPFRTLGWKIFAQGDWNLDWKKGWNCDWSGIEPYRWEAVQGGPYHEGDWVDRRNTGPCGKYDYSYTVNPSAHVDTAYSFNPTNSDHDWFQTYPWSPYETLNPFGNQELVRRVPGGVRVSGWAVDPDSTIPIDVHNYVGGDGENLGQSNLVRNDVRSLYPAFGRNHGFNGVNANYLPYGTYNVCSYGINVSGGTNTAVACSNLTYEVDAFGNLEYVNNAGGNTSFGWLINIAGWGLDPDTAGAIPIHVYTSEFFGASGTLGTPGAAGFAYSAGLNRPDLAPLFPEYGTNHGFDEWVGAPGSHQYLCAYAINAAGSGNWRIIGCNKFR